MSMKILKNACLGFLMLTATQAFSQDLMTAGGTLTVSQDNSGGPTANEGSPRLVDNDITTKIYVGSISLPWYMQWACNTPAMAMQYTLVSGNDSKTRDPKNWTLQGSNDGTTWTVIDTRVSETFPLRSQYRSFDIASPGVYKYYRFQMSATAGSANFQLMEWRLTTGVVPNAPTDFSGVSVSGDQISLKWTDNAKNETSYVIEKSTDGATFTTVATLGDNRSSYLVTNLLVNTEYYFRVKAVNAIGIGTSSIISKATLPNSGALQDVTDDGGKLAVYKENDGGATASEASSKLIDNNKSTKYLVYGSVPTDGYWARYRAQSQFIVTSYTITTANDDDTRDPRNWKFQGTNDTLTGWTDLDVQADQKFADRSTSYNYYFPNTTPYTYFRLLVLKNNGNSSIMGQIGEWEIWGINPSAPVVPDSLDAVAVTYTTATLKWKDMSSNETGFEIEKSDDGITFENTGTASANATSYQVTGLLGGFKYYFRIRAMGALSNSVYSAVVDTTTDYDPNLPLTPRQLDATAISQSAVTLLWNDNSDNETGFEIERSSNGVNYVKVGSTGVDINTFTDNSLTVASMYYYRVKAINSYGSSYYSNIDTALTQGQNIAPAFDIIADQDICTTDSTFTIDITGITNAESWQTITLGVVSNQAIFDNLIVTPVSNGAAQLSYNASKGGTATITVTAQDNGATYNGGEDSYSRTFTIVVNPLEVNIASNLGTLIPRYSTVQLTAAGAETYTWSDAHGIVSGQQSATLVAKPSINTSYIVLGENSRGCKGTDTITIQLEGNYKIDPVNAITPNGDGKNDRWVIWNINTFPDNEVTVVDRAGRVVFFQKNYMNDWSGTYNGKPLPEGAYLYIIKLGAGIPPVKGVLNIIRNSK